MGPLEGSEGGIKKIKNYSTPAVLSMESLKKRHKTVMYIEKIEVDTNQPANIF